MPNGKNMRETLFPPTIRLRNLMAPWNKNDHMIMHSPPLLQLSHPKIDELPTPTMIEHPESTNKATNIPTLPDLSRGIGQSQASSIVATKMNAQKLMPRPKTTP